MTVYETLIKHLFSLRSPCKRKTSLTNTKKLALALGNPQNCYPTIHIAGTNGKGSVAYKIAEALRLGGYRVGLYTSPHLITYRERITINQQMISEEEVIEGLQKLFRLTKTSQFFELTTLLAFDYFSKKNVEVAVIETGLGGRFDMTNIIQPLISIITTIDFDHQQVLGDTLEAIAMEKGGIIKTDIPIILGAQANCLVLRKIAQDQKAPLYLTEKCKDENEAIVCKALELLSPRFPLSEEAKLGGIIKQPCCRFEIINDHIVLDVAHNQSAFKRLFERIRTQFPGKRIYLLFAFSKDKSFDSLIDLFKEYVEEIVLFSSSHLRLKDPYDIAYKLKKRGYHRCKVFETDFDGFKYLLNKEKKERGMITIAGSFYMMKEALHYCSNASFSTS